MRYLLLTLLFPSLGIAVANGYAPGLVPLLLGAYYTCPLLLYRTGRLFRLPWRPAVPVEGLVLLLPYLPYWLYVGSSAIPLWRAYRAFFWGPGLAIPITLFLLAPWGLELPGWAVAAVTLGLALIIERILRRKKRQPVRDLAA